MIRCAFCGHFEDVHYPENKTINNIPAGAYCVVCLRNEMPETLSPTSPIFHKFNDNLDWVERLAKERGLI